MYKEQETMKNNQANSTIKELLELQDMNGVSGQAAGLRLDAREASAVCWQSEVALSPPPAF